MKCLKYKYKICLHITNLQVTVWWYCLFFSHLYYVRTTIFLLNKQTQIRFSRYVKFKLSRIAFNFKSRYSDGTLRQNVLFEERISFNIDFPSFSSIWYQSRPSTFMPPFFSGEFSSIRVLVTITRRVIKFVCCRGTINSTQVKPCVQNWLSSYFLWYQIT